MEWTVGKAVSDVGRERGWDWRCLAEYRTAADCVRVIVSDLTANSEHSVCVWPNIKPRWAVTGGRDSVGLDGELGTPPVHSAKYRTAVDSVKGRDRPGVDNSSGHISILSGQRQG